MLLHGFSSHRGVWRQTLEALQDTRYCVAPDQLGFGESAKPANADYSLEGHLSRALRLMDALSIKRFAIIGHSMGGQLALLAASLMLERVSCVISVAGVVIGWLMPIIESVTYP